MRRLVQAVALSLVASSAAAAGPDSMSIMVGSYHLPGTYEAAFNNRTPGVFFTWEGEVLDLSVGAYVNSYGGASGIVTVGHLWPVAPQLDVGLFAGLAYYPGEGDSFAVHFGDVVPLVGVQARWGSLWMQYIPSDGLYTAGTLSGGVTVALR